MEVQRAVVTRPQAMEVRLPRPSFSSSSDDSANSEASDRLLLLDEEASTAGHRRRRQRRRRAWVPAAERPPAITHQGPRAVLYEILRREHFVEQFLGDADTVGTRLRTIRVASANVAGGLGRRLHDEVIPWSLANRIDFVAVSDSGWRTTGARTIWGPSPDGGHAPAYEAVGSDRATLLMRHDLWATRWKRDATRTSPSGRSVAVTVRLGGRKEMTVVTTYCPDSPVENAEATRAEHSWLSRQVEAAHAAGRLCVLAGDFNNYASEALDRQGPERPRRLQQESEAFGRWVQSVNMVSSFRVRHPETPRYTYQNGGTRSSLDDIFVSSTHAGHIVASAVWLFSLNQGDHVGTPFAEIELREVSTGPAGRLREVTSIKTLRVKGRSAAEMETFAREVSNRVASGAFRIGEDAPPLDNEVGVREWIDSSIRCLYDGMYGTAKALWGERNQAQRYINACVSKKRSMRCQGQLKVARSLWLAEDATAADVAELVRKIQWPKWIVHPERTPPSSPHASGARLVYDWRLTECPRMTEAARDWAERGWRLWKQVLRIRRDWRARTKIERRQRKRSRWMENGNVRQVLRDTFGPPLPPIKIRGALVAAAEGTEYVESRAAVTGAMTDLLDTWIPHDERTSDPEHLASQAVEEEASLPRFVREWLLRDIKAGGTHQAAFADPAKGWGAFVYDEEMQRATDRMVSKGVAPGYGGVNQELWIAAPECIRARERLIFNVIAKSGVVPPVLNHRQMVFLPKSETASSVWERQGLPPWRPITMQSALATRLFTALSTFLESTVPNHANQHGFQRDRTVQDASLATTLLIDRARRRKEPLYLLSKDCEKCYDRIPRWVMTYIYQRLGVPPVLLRILTAFLSAGAIDVRTDFGWVPTGLREFGLGQGSVLSIRHIGYYMDVLLERQAQGPGAVQPTHSQQHPAPPITSIVLVDDIVDVATSHSAICDRASVSNVFTGLHGTGGVFGAAKSFLLSVRPGRPRPEPQVLLADGKGMPRAVAFVSPFAGFKHLGVIQSSTDMWSNTMGPIWRRLQTDAQRVCQAQPSLRELRYIVNCVWLPRLAYRTQLSSVLSHADHVDKLVRRVARRVLRLPFGTAKELFHDQEFGLGLQCFEDACRASRVELAIRVLNTPHVPAHHLLVEALEDYQKLAGLTSHPLSAPMTPPSHLQGWTIDTIRAAAALGVDVDVAWTNPAECTSTRPADRPLWQELSALDRRRLLRLNVACRTKLRFVGDLTDRRGQRLLSCEELAARHHWSAKMRTGYYSIEEMIRTSLCRDETDHLREPVGRVHHPSAHLRMAPIAVAPGAFFLVSQFEEVLDEQGVATDIALCYHELGQRIGDGTREDEHGNGELIAVQWWHERTHGSGVWSLRPEGIGEEFADVVLPISVTAAGPRARPMANVILWQDTHRRGVHGSNDRGMVDTAFQLSRARFHARRQGLLRADASRACVGCNRIRDITFCTVCVRWHHPECVRCDRAAASVGRATWARRGPGTDDGGVPAYAHRAAGDGSVRAGGKPDASGSWALTSPTACIVGRTRAHWRDITSTRCELHALIEGIALSGDVGEQVCDNQSAIQLLDVARDIATGRRPNHIKHSSKHRCELRSLIRLMQPGGTFHAVWVRSHEEETVSDDVILNERRQALAIADRLAGSGHASRDTDRANDRIVWDWATLVDSEGLPVMGATMPVLIGRARELRRGAWMRRLERKGLEFATITSTACDTMALLQWPDSRKRFYWRAIASVLHTNAQKHRIVPAWPGHCRQCPGDVTDTQAHRFGCAVPACVATPALAADISASIHALCYSQWLPDQAAYLPSHGHDLALATELPTRAWWSTRHTDTATWRPMVNTLGDEWIHACQLHLLVADAEQYSYASELLRADAQDPPRFPGGRLLPTRLQRAVHRCAPRAAAVGVHPIQITTVWTNGTLDDRYDQRDSLRLQQPPPGASQLWIDDIYKPHSQPWWTDVMRRHNVSPSTTKAIWVACYANSPGHATLSAHACAWYVLIPSGALRMRSSQSVIQTAPVTRGQIVTRNPRPIYIGVIGPDVSHADAHHLRHCWRDTLQYDYDPEWLQLEHLHHGQRGAGDLQDLAIWTPAAVRAAPAPAASLSQVWLHEQFPAVYAAPEGWRAWPTASPTTSAWALALSTSRRQGTLLHTGILRTIWDANFTHWVRTCAANHAAIVHAGGAPALDGANNHINQGVRAHQHFRFGLDTQLASAADRQARRTAEWCRATT